MSISGAGLYSNDEAHDVRAMFRELIGDGLTTEEAAARLEAEWEETHRKFPESVPLFWLALADTQWNLGRLTPKVKKRALEMIDGGVDLANFQHDSKLLRQRTRVLSSLRDKLLSPQPVEKKAKKTRRFVTELEIGDVLSFRLRSGRFALLRVLGHTEGGDERYAICEVLDWVGQEPPEAGDLAQMPARAEQQHGFPARIMLIEPGPRQKERARLTKLDVNSQPSQKAQMPYAVWPWQLIDQYMESTFGLT